jgi:hypothetical protein
VAIGHARINEYTKYEIRNTNTRDVCRPPATFYRQHATCYLLLAICLLLTACAPATGRNEPGAESVATVVPAATLLAPSIIQNAGPTPSAATAAAVAALNETGAPPATGLPPTGTPVPTSTPEPTPTIEPSPTPRGPQAINGVDLSDIAPLPPETAANVAAIYARGQAMGRNPRAFSKLGDSTILNPHFLGPFDAGTYNLGEFAYLQPAVDRFAGSFARHGVGARHGLHSWSVFDPLWANEKWCDAGEHLLACEFRLNNPAFLFVRLGSNDAGSPGGFRFNVKEVIEFSLDNGVVPIIGTKADRFEGSNENNDILRALAAEYHVPLWDFDLLAETLPGRDLDSDGVHLKIVDLPHDYTQEETFERGHPLQDLSALIVLDQLRRVVEE